VCDSRDEARALAYAEGAAGGGGGRGGNRAGRSGAAAAPADNALSAAAERVAGRHKVVAVDGTLFRPNGVFTGGSTAASDARAGRWDERALEQLKGEREAARRELSESADPRPMQQQAQALAVEISALEDKATYSEAEARTGAERAEAARGEAVSLEREAATREESIPPLERAVSERSARLQTLSTRINEVADRVFGDFSRRVGVASIREFEETTVKAAERLDAQKRELEGQAARSRAQIEFERAHDHAGALARAERALRSDEAALESARAQAAEAEREAAALEEAAAEARREAEALSGRASEAEAELRTFRERAQGHEREAARLRRAAEAAREALEQERARARDVLSAAALERLKLPRLDGREEEEGEEEGEEGGAAAGGSGGDAEMAEARPPARRRSRRGSGDDEEEDEDAMEVDGGGKGKKKKSKGGGGDDDEQQEEQQEEGDGDNDDPGAALDFALLQRKHTQPSSRQPSERAAVDRQLRDIAQALAQALERSSPNLKAIEQYDKLKEREAEAAASLEAARRDAQRAARLFAEVRHRRRAAYEACFKHVRDAIDGVYRRLTTSRAHPMGGTAYLSLDNVSGCVWGGRRLMPPVAGAGDALFTPQTSHLPRPPPTLTPTTQT
jgi:structural maintenance of chromosome 1